MNVVDFYACHGVCKCGRLLGMSWGVCDCMGGAGALEQESWSAVPVPHDSQHLVDDWTERAAQLKTLASKPNKPTTNGIASPAGEHSSDSPAPCCTSVC